MGADAAWPCSRAGSAACPSRAPEPTGSCRWPVGGAAALGGDGRMRLGARIVLRGLWRAGWDGGAPSGHGPRQPMACSCSCPGSNQIGRVFFSTT
jgi:hypothetical protein